MAGFNAALGFRKAEGEAGFVLETRPEHEAAPGTVHFAVLATLAEVAAAEAVAAPVVPATLQLNLMSRARPGVLEASGRLLRRGRTQAVAEGEVRQEGKLVAKATVTFALLQAL